MNHIKIKRLGLKMMMSTQVSKIEKAVELEIMYYVRSALNQQSANLRIYRAHNQQEKAVRELFSTKLLLKSTIA